MALFFSSNDNGNDHLKSGQLWSEELGALYPFACACDDERFIILPADACPGMPRVVSAAFSLLRPIFGTVLSHGHNPLFRHSNGISGLEI